MIILLLVSVSLKCFKDKYLSLVSMTLIGDEDFGATNLVTQFYFSPAAGQVRNCTSELRRT